MSDDKCDDCSFEEYTDCCRSFETTAEGLLAVGSDPFNVLSAMARVLAVFAEQFEEDAVTMVSESCEALEAEPVLEPVPSVEKSN